MPRFVQFLERSGVFEDQSFMVVPRDGFNLVCLRDGHDVRLSYDPNRLKAEFLRLDQVETVARDYMQARLGKLNSQERSDQLLRLRSALYACVQPKATARALKITALGTGTMDLTVTRGTTKLSLNIGILTRTDYKIAFKFLKRLDETGTLIQATKYAPDDVDLFVTKLNWTFGAQANIFFTAVDSSWLPIQKVLPKKIPRDLFTNEIAPLKSKVAHITCFLVGDYDATTTEAAGEYLPVQQVCVVVDAGNPGVFDLGDEFIGVMAHEIGHFLHHKRGMPADGHHDRGGILLSSKTESLWLDKQLVINFNIWR